MKNLLLALALAVAPLAAVAACSSHSYYIDNKLVICTTCCSGSYCTTSCN